MMVKTVFIVTRDRYQNLRKIIPRWFDQGFGVVLVVEECEREAHQEFLAWSNWRQVDVISPDRRERGIGYARAYAVGTAHQLHLDSIIMSDDDMRPSTDSDMGLLLEKAARPGVLGVGAVRHLHNLFTGGAISRNKGLILCPGGWGMQLFALNVYTTMQVGNFDERLTCFGEDAELMRRGIELGIPWLVHCGVTCEAIGPRYAPGGLHASAGPNRAFKEVECRRIIHEMWPEYTSKPEGRPRMAWAKMLDDYIPGWRLRSAIHGGDLRNGYARPHP